MLPRPTHADAEVFQKEQALVTGKNGAEENAV
jgi:hypothetical protein